MEYILRYPKVCPFYSRGFAYIAEYPFQGAMPLSEDIVVCRDGIANEFAKNNTNLVKLYSTLVNDSDVGLRFIIRGIGTMEPARELSPARRRIAKVPGMAAVDWLA